MANQKPRPGMDEDSYLITKQEFIATTVFFLATVGLFIFGIIFLLVGTTFLINILIFGAVIAMSFFLSQAIFPRSPKLRWMTCVFIVLGVILMPDFVIRIQTALFADDLAPDIHQKFGELTDIRITSIDFGHASVTGIGSCCCIGETSLEKEGRAIYELELRKERQGWELDSWDVKESECA